MKVDYKKALEIIAEVKKSNPYPEDRFVGPTPLELAMLQQYLVGHDLTLDKFSGAWGREVWNNCCDTIIEEIKQEGK